MQRTIQRVIHICVTTHPKAGLCQQGVQAGGVDSSTSWGGVCPSHSEKPSEAVKTLLKEIIPRFGLYLLILRDHGNAFISSILQEVSKVPGTQWNLHTS